MRNRIIFGYLAGLLFSLLFSTFTFGQPLIYNDPNLFTLDINALPPPPPVANLDVFEELPFYKAFMIYGDGNYQLLPGKFTGVHNFSHTYSYNNEYPGIMLFMERKTDTPPPAFRQSVLPEGPATSGGGIINSSSLAFPPPTNMAIIDPSSHPKLTSAPEFVALDFSHHDGTNYYLENDKLVAFPIAYKPTTTGILLFFYNDSPSGAVDEIINWDPSIDPAVPFGTYFPHYQDNAVETITDLKAKDAATTGVISTVLPMFQNVIEYNVPREESTFYDHSTGELRLFHLMKTNNLEPRHYRFLAVYYEEDKNTNAINYNLKKNILGSSANQLPEHYSSNKNPSRSYSFQDADLIEVRQGEPDDPNQLKITDICRCDKEHHIVTFELEFCNEAEFAGAEGATIVLDDPHKVFSCIEFNNVERGSECSSSDPCFEDCKQVFTTIDDEKEDKRFCINVPLNKKDGRCDRISFSAKINSKNLGLLWEKPVLEYCVILHPVTLASGSGPKLSGSTELCKPNCLLDSLILIDSLIIDPELNDTTSFSKLIPNPIWTNRNIACQNGTNCCLTSPPICGWWCKFWLCLFIVSFIGFYFYRKRGKN